jgi:YhcH/YjgK/YiaL family protein
MIYTKRKNLDRYLGISPEMDTAIRYLQSADLRTLVKGRNEIDGDNVFVNRFDYQTMPQAQAIWEGHIRYADIHVLLSGNEKIGARVCCGGICREIHDLVLRGRSVGRCVVHDDVLRLGAPV